MLRKLLLWIGGLTVVILLLFWIYPHSLFYAFVLLLLAANRENDAPANQLTLVQGRVTSAQGGRPLAGVLLAIESYKPLEAPYGYSPTGDSVRTDARGYYALRFVNKAGHYYLVSLEPSIPDTTDGSVPPPRYQFLTHGGPQDSELNAHERALTLGETNRWDFQPDEPLVVAVRLRYRSVNCQQIEWSIGGETGFLPGSLSDTTLCLNIYDRPLRPITGGQFRFYHTTAGGDWVGDTLEMVVHTPTVQPPDTVRATVGLGR